METVAFFLFLTLIFWLMYWPWQAHCVDVARQRMFTLRDELFDLAAADRISFKSSSYRNMRRMFNTSIRFAHRMTWLEILLIGLAMFGRPRRPNVVQQIVEGIGDRETQRAVARLQAKLFREAIRLIIFRSPVLTLLLALVYVPAAIMIIFLPSVRDGLRKAQQQVGAYVVQESDAVDVDLTCAANG